MVVKRFKWYSWLRFKYFANEISTLDNILSSEKLFLEVLDKVHTYYRRHITEAKCHEQEGLEEYKGPQCFADKDNKALLD